MNPQKKLLNKADLVMTRPCLRVFSHSAASNGLHSRRARDRDESVCRIWPAATSEAFLLLSQIQAHPVAASR